MNHLFHLVWCLFTLEKSCDTTDDVYITSDLSVNHLFILIYSGRIFRHQAQVREIIMDKK